MKHSSNQKKHVALISFLRMIKPPSFVSVIFLIVVSLLIGSVSMIKTNSGIIREIYIAVQLVFFLCAGLLYSWYWPTNEKLRIVEEGRKLTDAFMVTAVFTIILLVYYSLAGGSLVLTLSGASAFLFPFLLEESWIKQNEIPTREYKSLRFNSLPENSLAGSLKNSVSVQFRLTPKYYGIQESNFEVMVSERMRLGTVFQHFVKGQNIINQENAIEFIDPMGEPVNWRFYKTIMGGLFKQYLDPDINLLQNNVKAYTVINIQRV